MSTVHQELKEQVLALMAGDLDDQAARRLLARLREPDSPLDELLRSDDPRLQAAFSRLSVQLARPAPGPAEARQALARLRLALPELTGERRAAPAVSSPSGWFSRLTSRLLEKPLLLAPAAVAFLLLLGAGLLWQLRGPTGTLQPPGAGTDELGLKGQAAELPLEVRLELLLERKDGATLAAPGKPVSSSDRVLVRARPSQAAWLYLIHTGPQGLVAVLPFAGEPSPPQPVLPRAGGRPQAYALDGEPGPHRFTVVASPDPLDPVRLQAGQLPPGAVLAEQLLEVR